MTDVHMDHFITFADVKNVDDHAETYAARGFLVTEETRRYQPGLRNRFVTLGLEYLELAWVENKAVFKAGGDEEFARMFPNLPALRTAARPFGIGFMSADVVALHREWMARGYDIPDVWSFVPPNHPPVFTFQEIPPTLLPGVSSFALMYHGASPDAVRQVKIAPNGVYAVEGVSFVSATPETEAAQWRDVLAREAELDYHEGVYSVVIGAHTAHWMTPDVYTQHYRVDWTDAPHSSGKLGALHLLVTNLDTAAQHLGMGVERSGETLVIPPNPHDGFTFTLREVPVQRWLDERAARTGENIRVEG
jgi:hypothetical protein